MKLVRVITIFRHGARTPNNLEMGTGWDLHHERSLGMLTVSGKLSSYVLGQQVRKRYYKLIGDDGRDGLWKMASEPLKEWMMRSSSRKRAFESAEYFLRGFFGYQHGLPSEEIKGFVRNAEANNQTTVLGTSDLHQILKQDNRLGKLKKPLLILMPEKSHDKLLKSHHVEVCKHGKAKSEEIAELHLENHLNSDSKRKFRKVSESIAKAWNISRPVSPRLMKKLADVCISHIYHHPSDSFCLKLPDIVSYITKLGALVHSSHYNHKAYLKVSLHHLLSHLLRYLSTNTVESQKFLFFSTHESTLTPLLKLFGYKSWNQPMPYSSHLTIEVYTNQVRVLFNWEPISLPCKDNLNTPASSSGYRPVTFAALLRQQGMFSSDNEFDLYCSTPVATKDLKRLADKLFGWWQLPLVCLSVGAAVLGWQLLKTKKLVSQLIKPKNH